MKKKDIILIALAVIIVVLLFMGMIKITNHKHIKDDFSNLNMVITNNLDGENNKTEVQLYADQFLSVYNKNNMTNSVFKNANGIFVIKQNITDNESHIVKYDFLTYSDYDMANLYYYFSKKIKHSSIKDMLGNKVKFDSTETKSIHQIADFIDEKYKQSLNDNELECSYSLNNNYLSHISCTENKKQVLVLDFNKYNELQVPDYYDAIESNLGATYLADFQLSTLNSDITVSNTTNTLNTSLTMYVDKGDSIYTNENGTFAELDGTPSLKYYKKTDNGFVSYSKTSSDIYEFEFYYNLSLIYNSYSPFESDITDVELSDSENQILVSNLNQILSQPISTDEHFTCDFSISGNIVSEIHCLGSKNTKVDIIFKQFNEASDDDLDTLIKNNN